jgi:CheY-like chemotaxis protein
MIAVEQLEELGYHVLEAGDGPAALKILNGKTSIDLLVTDVGLPLGMNGRQLADAARVQRPNLKVLFVTGYAENAVLNHGHLGQGMQVLTKPFPMDVLAQRVKTMISKV